MSKPIARHPLVWTLPGLLGVVALLASCAGGVARTGGPSAGSPGAGPSATTTSSSSSHPSATATSVGNTTISGLSCQIVMKPQGVDTVVTTLTCAVRGAPASDTSFSVRYSVHNSTGTHDFAPDCVGSLSGGHGSCSQRYYTSVPLILGKGSVIGATQPDQLALGPVTPAPPPSSTPPPFGTPWPGGFPTFTPRA